MQDSEPCTPSGTSEPLRPHKLLENVESDSDLESPLPPYRKKRRTIDKMLGSSGEDEDHTSASTDSIVELSTKRRKVSTKCEEDAVPLPDPFPLPKHYSTEVEVALKAGRLTNVTRQAFVGKVASSMLYYKRYPTSDDYINVGRTVIQKYPFMKSPAGSPAVSYLAIA